MLENQRIIGISGRKQSGKNTTVNFFHSIALYHFRVTPRAMVDPDTGQLVIELANKELGVLDLNNRSEEFKTFMSEHLWPFMKKFSYAEKLKEFATDVLGLEESQVYGTDEEKNTLTKYNWEDMPIPPGYYQKAKTGNNYQQIKQNPKGSMTAREVLQYFGTEIGRQMYGNIWTEACIRSIKKSQTGLALIDDVRFSNEVDAIRNEGGKVIRLTRVVNPEDKHPSETALDKENYDWSNFDYVVDNQNLSIEETNKIIFDIMAKEGIVEV